MSKASDEQGPRPGSGTPVVDGIAIGRAIVWASDPAPPAVAGTVAQEHLRLARAIRQATRGVEELVRLLPRTEAELFEPELAILAELGPSLLAKVDRGVPAEEAVAAALSALPTDLLIDARARLLDGLAHDPRTVESLMEGRDGDRVLVTETLTPSVVASLPGRVVGIIAAAPDESQGRGGAHASHAAILARGRVIPFAVVAPHVISGIANDDVVILDATGSTASVWVSPGPSIIADAHARREHWTRTRGEEETQVKAPLAHLGLEVRINVGSLHEHVPGSADGIGLVRTELLFASRTHAPSELEQFGALRVLGTRVGKAPLVVRLFDAGGDKPLTWLRAPDTSPGLRGIALLFGHPAVLDAQLRAILRAAAGADVRALLPIVTCPGDVENIRARVKGKIPIGAMIETPEAVDQCEDIARVSDFICVGTNDLCASMSGSGDIGSRLSCDRRVLRMIERIIAAAKSYACKVTVCGEMAGEPHSARTLVGLGVHAISVAPGRYAKVKLSFRDVTLDDCRCVAAEALK
jgi:phosphoenolpyruvate-protein kinase (PTS system EI component)